jgi:thiol-disulfide isomerase/thioredoxin
MQLTTSFFSQNGKRMRKFVTLSLAMALVVIGTGCFQSKPKVPRDANMLNFTVSDLNGKSLDMREHLGKVVIVDIWDTWCGPCRMEIPHFIDLYSRYHSKGLEIIGVALAREGKDKVKAFVAQNGINYTSALYNDEAQKLFGMPNGIPTTYIIDQNGNIAEKIVGARDKAYFETKIKSLLKLS